MYSIKKVSEILDIPTVTIRAWENRYQIITPKRSNGGHRIYSEADINILRWVKNQINENGLKISEAVYLLKQGVSSSPVEDNVTADINHNYYVLINRLYEELIDFNTTGAHETIDLAFSIYYYEDVFHHLFVPILIQLGTEWENHNITVAQEHFSSQLIMQRIIQFFRILPVHHHLPKALALCPEGENHYIGLMLFSLFMRKKGMEVIYLGPNTPLNQLGSIIKEKNISVVAVSINSPEYIGILEKWIVECLAECPNLQFTLGGQGFKNCTSFIATYVQSVNQEQWELWYQSLLKKLNI